MQHKPETKEGQTSTKQLFPATSQCAIALHVKLACKSPFLWLLNVKRVRHWDHSPCALCEVSNHVECFMRKCPFLTVNSSHADVSSAARVRSQSTRCTSGQSRDICFLSVSFWLAVFIWPSFATLCEPGQNQAHPSADSVKCDLSNTLKWRHILPAYHRKWFLEKSLQSAVDLFLFLLYLSTFFPKTHSELSQIFPDTFGIYRSELTLTLMESTVKADRENGEQLFNEGSLI